MPDEEEKNHFPLDFNRANYKKYLLPLAIYLLIALILFWPVTTNITSTVAAGGPGITQAGTGDLYQNLWSMWWVNYAIFDLHTSPYYTNLLFYPTGANLATETLSPLAGLFSYIFQSVSLGFAFNILLFVDFALSGFFMFLLADYIIKNKYAAFISGVIFAFSPFHMVHALFGHTNWAGIEFIPLFILFFLLMIRDKKAFALFGTSVSFVLLVFFGDPEQGIICLVLILFLLLFKLLTRTGREELLNKKFFMCVFFVAILTFILSSPFLVPIIYGIMHGALSLAGESSSVTNSMIWSTPVLSFFLPTPSNNIFSIFSNAYITIYAPNSTERTSYIGYVVLALVLTAVINDIKKNKFKHTAVWVALGIIFAWISLGPYLQLGALPSTPSGQTSIPGIYLLYRIIPVFNLVREPARFDVIVTLCLAILAGFGFREILKSPRNERWNNRKPTNYLVLFITILIVAEYAGIPFSSSFISSQFLKLAIPSGYKQIANVSGNFSVMLLPILSSHTNRPELYTGLSMYYQTVFKKPIVGGYTSRENATDQYLRLNMPLSVAAASLQAGGLFAYASVITQNYTNVTLLFLSKYHTRFISTINQAFTKNELIILDYYLNSTFGHPMYTDNLTSIWSVSNAVQKAANRSVVAYFSQGNWTYGCSVLGPILCNSSQDTLWYGPNVRAINVSVPQNKTKLLMGFSAASLNKNVTLYLFQTSDKHMLGAAKLSGKIANYQLNLTLNPGTTALFFVAENLTTASVNQMFDFGIRNITFRPR